MKNLTHSVSFSLLHISTSDRNLAETFGTKSTAIVAQTFSGHYFAVLSPAINPFNFGKQDGDSLDYLHIGRLQTIFLGRIIHRCLM